MTISIGDKLPEATFRTIVDGQPAVLSTTDVFAGKKVVLFGVPGAFTNTCSNDHVPGYVENLDMLRAKGVDTVAVVSVNDHHVMEAWANFTGGKDKLLFLADFDGGFAKAIGLAEDLSHRGLGLRCKRFSMIVDNGEVTGLNIEPKRGQAIETGAIKILEAL